jgi:hypothetical protein
MPLRSCPDAPKSFLKVTLVGGLMFLVPVVWLLLVLRHATPFAATIATPLAAMPPPEGAHRDGTCLRGVVVADRPVTGAGFNA